MVPYQQIDVAAPLAAALPAKGLTFAGGLITLGILAGMTSSLLVGNLSQPRILMAMARDGMLPVSFFAAVHPRFKTPWKSTILVGVGRRRWAAHWRRSSFLADLVSIGTLFAFVIVSRGGLDPPDHRPRRCRGRSARPALPFVSTMGILVNGGLMFSLGRDNWIRLFVWLVLGLADLFRLQPAPFGAQANRCRARGRGGPRRGDRRADRLGVSQPWPPAGTTIGGRHVRRRPATHRPGVPVISCPRSGRRC